VGLLGRLRHVFGAPPPVFVEPDPFPAKRRGDGWQNAMTGFGTSRDKIQYGRYRANLELDWNELESLFYSDDVAAKLVEKRPEEAFRRGYELLNPDDQEAVAPVLELAKELDVDGKMQEGSTWGRLYGGALVVIGAEHGAPNTPLDEENPGEVRFLNVVDRRFIRVKEYYTDPLSPKYGQPKIYTISASVAGDGAPVVDVHESRTIRFDGIPVDVRTRQLLGGWTYSVLQRPYDVMRTFATAFQAAGILTADASQAVFKMKGLFEMIASGEKDRLQTRMAMVDMSRSSARAVLLDSDGEDFQRIATSFTGLPEMLDRMMMRLASSIDMPVTILMGRSPAGQNATGDSDFQHWYDSIASQQKKEFSPKLLRLYRILSKGKLKNASIEWCPLAEMTDQERANVEKTKAETYAIYVDKQVLFPEEVALAKFGKDSNGEVEIDEEARQESLDQEIELALNPPPAPVVGQVPPGGQPAQGTPPNASPQQPYPKT